MSPSTQRLLCFAISVLLTPPLVAAEPEFRSIFDGKSLDGWDGDSKFWRVVDGAITGETTLENPTPGNTFIIWRAGELGDFELKLKYKIVGGNSGIQYRSFEAPDMKWVIGGYQADLEADDTYSGILYDERGRGILAERGQKTVIGDDHKPQVVGNLGDSKAIQAKIKKEDWNEYHVSARGFHFIHRINGVTTAEVTDNDASGRRAKGLLALQVHAGPPMKVQFKDIQLKQLSAPTTSSLSAPQETPWVVYPGNKGPGTGKKIVLVSGDEEYRSEEALPQLGKILAHHHGFDCTVLFSINRASGEIDPETRDNIPGLETLHDADLLVMFTRFRALPQEQVTPIIEYLRSGRPVLGMRTATHAFHFESNDPNFRWDFQSNVAGHEQGFGRVVLGETWINHHGDHGRESTRGVIAPGAEAHPIVCGVQDVWGPTDVYGVRLPLPGDSKPLVLGQVVAGMTSDAGPVSGKKNDPMMPIAWIKSYQIEGGQPGRSFTTTMGASEDLQSAGLRRLLVNATYWLLGMDAAIDPHSCVDLVGDYRPTHFAFGKHQKGLRPSDLR